MEFINKNHFLDYCIKMASIGYLIEDALIDNICLKYDIDSSSLKEKIKENYIEVDKSNEIIEAIYNIINSTSIPHFTKEALLNNLDENENRVLSHFLLEIKDSYYDSELIERALFDNDAKEQLILANIPKVLDIALIYKDLSLPLTDLIQEGNISLMEAISSYNKDYDFDTYIYFSLKIGLAQAILNDLDDKKQYDILIEVVNAIENKEKELTLDFGRVPLKEEVIEEVSLNYPYDLVLNAYKIKEDIKNLEEKKEVKEETKEEDKIEENEENDNNKKLIASLLAKLAPNEEKVISFRFGLNGNKEHSVESIAALFNLTINEVNAIIEKALNKLKS